MLNGRPDTLCTRGEVNARVSLVLGNWEEAGESGEEDLTGRRRRAAGPRRCAKFGKVSGAAASVALFAPAQLHLQRSLSQPQLARTRGVDRLPRLWQAGATWRPEQGPVTSINPRARQSITVNVHPPARTRAHTAAALPRLKPRPQTKFGKVDFWEGGAKRLTSHKTNARDAHVHP